MIPEISLSLKPRFTDYQYVRRILEDYGYFALTNTGISYKELLEVETVAREFFNLPLKTKMQIHQEDSGMGYIPFKKESLAGSDGDTYQGDLKETLNLGRNWGIDPWPYTPDNLPMVCLDYIYKVEKIATKLLELFARTLELESNYFIDRIGRPNMILRLAYYPATNEKSLEGQYRASPHTDYGTMTFVWASDMTGLQALNRKTGQWEDAGDAVLPQDALFVNIGDMLSLWTNDKWQACMHRVVVPEDTSTDRLSVVLFHNPSDDTIIEPIPYKNYDGVNYSRYEPISARDWRKRKSNNSRNIIGEKIMPKASGAGGKGSNRSDEGVLNNILTPLYNSVSIRVGRRYSGIVIKSPEVLSGMSESSLQNLDRRITKAFSGYMSTTSSQALNDYGELVKKIRILKNTSSSPIK